MSTAALHIHDRVVVEREHLPQVLAYLNSNGYQVIGPTVREQAIVYDTLTSLDDLPIGYTDEQDGGSYRLKRRHDRALFGYAVGPQSWKKFLHPPSVRLWQADRAEQGFRIASEQPETPKLAFFGVRPCELHAIAIQDRVFMHGEHTDPIYRARRENLCIIAVNCSHAGGTCFCVSMQTGPKADSGFDLALTEILDEQRHYVMVEVGSQLGIEILQAVPHSKAEQSDIQRAEAIIANTAAHMGRSMDTT